MPLRSRLEVVLVACLLLVAVSAAGCGDAESDRAEVEAAERKTLEAERKLEQVRMERIQEEREADEAREAEAKQAREDARKDERRKVRAERAQAAEQAQGEEISETSEPPDVVGLPLPAARKALKRGGYEIEPTNTDTTFGIIVEENYTVCSQDPPRGTIVVVLAQKYGC